VSKIFDTFSKSGADIFELIRPIVDGDHESAAHGGTGTRAARKPAPARAPIPNEAAAPDESALAQVRTLDPHVPEPSPLLPFESGQWRASEQYRVLSERADQLAAAVKHLQDYFQPDQNVTMQVDHATGESYVKIVDAKTKQLVLQIPSKEVLAMAQKLREMAYPQSASGVLVDHQG